MLALASVGGAHPAAGAGPTGLTVGTLGKIGPLDPRHGFSKIAKEVWNLQYPTLTSLDPTTLDPAPGLAVAWTPAPGGRGWIYKLRPGVTWSDGQPVTAADVVYSINHGGDWPYTYLPVGDSFSSRLSAVALDARSVQVTPTDVRDDLPGLLVHVVPEHVFSKVSNLDSNLSALGVADGAWRVTARTPDSVQLDAARASGGSAPQQIVFRTYPSANALVDALAHKQVDVVSGLPDSDIARLMALPDVTVDHASDGRQFLLRDRLGNERDRQAISLAIDRTALVADAVHGVGTAGVVPLIARGATWALDDPTAQSLTDALDAQPNRSRRLLADAPPLGRKLTLGVSFRDPVARRVATPVQRALAAVGVDSTIENTDENDGVSSRGSAPVRQQLLRQSVLPFERIRPHRVRPVRKGAAPSVARLRNPDHDRTPADRTGHVAGKGRRPVPARRPAGVPDRPVHRLPLRAATAQARGVRPDDLAVQRVVRRASAAGRRLEQYDLRGRRGRRARALRRDLRHRRVGPAAIRHVKGDP